MADYVIDGLFLTQRITGIQRYAYEIVRELDKLVKKDEIILLVPKSAKNLPQYENINVIRYGIFDGKNKLSGMLWQQIDLAIFLARAKAKCLCLTNFFPFFYANGVVVIHDVCYKAHPEFFKTSYMGLSILRHKINYWRAAHSKIKIVTDSDFSKSEIIKYYHINSERINVIYCGWQHINRITASQSTFERYPMLKGKDFYFSMSTLSANKNFKWILYAAKNNPDKIFAIAGSGKLKGAAEAMGFIDLPNIHFLGYVSDEDAKTLMSECKAFLFPTLYEGFGMPPLEAIACGCKTIVVSDTPCMHEIYGDFAAYIDPHNFKFIFDDRIDARNNFEELLGRYNWKESAKILYDTLKN